MSFMSSPLTVNRQLVCDTPQGCASGHCLMDDYLGILQLGYFSDSVKTCTDEGN